jgi:hypothetical protein
MSITVTPIPRLIDLAAPAFTLGTANAAGAAATAVSSNSTLLAFDTTLPDAITYGQSGAVGSSTTAARRSHVHAMAAEPTPAGWSRQAGSTTVAGTSSTSAATLVAFTSLSFADNAPIQIIVSCRKTNDAAVDAGVGLTVNSTAVWAAVVGAGIWHSSANNETSEGIANVYLHQPADSEPESPLATFSAYTTAGTLRVATFSSNLTNAVPTASITGLTITGIVGDAAIVCRIKSVQVYEGTVS